MNKYVVFLRIFSQSPVYAAPWQTSSTESSTGSGFIIELKTSDDDRKKFILTNAHCAQNSTFIECIKTGDSRAYAMHVYDIRPESDLALLEPIDNTFWKGLKPAKIAASDATHGSVFVVGYPKGGTNSSITRGIISRYMCIEYNYAIMNAVIQIDAAINPGNSGGPVFNESGEVIGVAFSHQADAQNMCYVIPASIVQHYLQDVARNWHSQRVCDLDISIDPLENADIRSCLLPDDFNLEWGVIVRKVNVAGTCDGFLQPGDVLLDLDNEHVDRNGMINREGVLLPYYHIMRLKYPADPIDIQYVRDKKIHHIQVPAKSMTPKRVPKLEADISTKYYIFAGLVLLPLSSWYISNPERPPDQQLCLNRSELIAYCDEPHVTPNDEIILLANVLPSKFNSGYRRSNIRLMKINDIEICNLQQVHDICEKLEKNRKYIKFEFAKNHIMIFEHKRCLNNSASIAESYIGKNYHNLNINDEQ